MAVHLFPKRGIAMTRRQSLIGAVVLLAVAGIVCGSHAVLSALAAQTPNNMLKVTPLPTPGSYKIDPVHSFAYFGARHHVVGLVRGRFEKMNGTITSSRNPAECAVDVNIDIDSLTTQNSRRDKDLRGPDYFDAAKFQTMRYQGHGIRHLSGNNWVMDGELTLHGVTRTVQLNFAYNGAFADQDPGDPMRLAFHGTAGVKRADFGMGARDNASELGSLTTPDVAIEIDVEADAIAPVK
jgi:polyisoprenoid-binding protein YceI